MLKTVLVHAVLIFSLASAGCASTSSTPLAADSPPPAHTEQQLCARSADGQLRKLAPGEQCLAPVTASFWLSRVPVRAQSGEKYCISVPPAQTWLDASIINTPPGGSKGSLLMNAALPFRRHFDADWFVLYGAVVADDVASTDEYASTDLQQHTCFDIPPTPKPATLAFYPNDAHGFYWNNHGRIWIWISRCDSGTQGAHCPAANTTSLAHAPALK